MEKTNKKGKAKKGKRHSIGERYGGGIVFWIDPSGKHGLISALQDIGSERTLSDAIRLCKDYNAGGYKDWYLPSVKELGLLHQQRGIVGGFANVAYWSSTEYNKDLVWNLDWHNGYSVTNHKYSDYFKLRVRAVRAF